MAVLKRDEASNLASDLNVNDVHTILGKESAFEGKLVFDGTVRIDGRFKGEIKTDNVLVIGQGARVDATVNVGSIVINGEVTGDITAKHSVEIHAPGKLRGNMSTPTLVIDRGVVFEGTCKMEEAQSAKPPAQVTLLTNRDKDNT
ncbi:MAG: polymer-forming cytoskeletal protein [Deltaproteobacteria bacterium]|nr:polymer-forming cytoskeletal protein [Deltaproteobacteria bacterium]